MRKMQKACSKLPFKKTGLGAFPNTNATCKNQTLLKMIT